MMQCAFWLLIIAVYYLLQKLFYVVKCIYSFSQKESYGNYYLLQLFSFYTYIYNVVFKHQFH